MHSQISVTFTFGYWVTFKIYYIRSFEDYSRNFNNKIHLNLKKKKMYALKVSFELSEICSKTLLPLFVHLYIHFSTPILITFFPCHLYIQIVYELNSHRTGSKSRFSWALSIEHWWKSADWRWINQYKMKMKKQTKTYIFFLSFRQEYVLERRGSKDTEHFTKKWKKKKKELIIKSWAMSNQRSSHVRRKWVQPWQTTPPHRHHTSICTIWSYHNLQIDFTSVIQYVIIN